MRKLMYIILLLLLISCYTIPKERQVVRLKITLVRFDNEDYLTKWAVWKDEFNEEYFEEVNVNTLLKLGDVSYILKQR